MSSKWMILAGAAALAANDGIAAQEHAAPHQSHDVGPAPVRLSRVRLATGVELQVAETGPADGVPVLFLHGYPDSWYSFTPVLDRLPPGVRAIVPSQRDTEIPSGRTAAGGSRADGAHPGLPGEQRGRAPSRRLSERARRGERESAGNGLA